MPTARTWGAACVVAALVSALAACTPDDDSTPTPSPTPTALPAPQPGQLTRILGAGRAGSLSRPGYGPALAVNRPKILAVAPSSALMGIEDFAPAMWVMQPSGRVEPLMSPGGASSSRPAAAVATEARLILAAPRSALIVGNNVTGELASTGAPLPDLPEGRWASSFVRLGTDDLLQFGPLWFTVNHLDSDNPTVTARDALEPDTVAAAQDGDDVLVLTTRELIRVSADGKVGGRAAWSLPAQVGDIVLTSATGDGSGGLVLAYAGSLTNASSVGSIVHVKADGTTTILANGKQPATGSQDCDDADQPAMSAHLAQPISIVRWNDRLVVADQQCNSLLQLSLPGT